MQLTEFECANCGAAAMVKAADGQLVCTFCGSAFGEAVRICPKCGRYHEEGVRHCARCGARIVRDCPVCGADNWVLSEFCDQCGRNLDMVERMAQRWQKTTQDRLAERRATVGALKESEERASQQRMAAMMEAERQRLEALAHAEAQQQERDRRVYIALSVAIVVLLAVTAMVLLIMSIIR
ncbi:MAG: zinc ribbon domain-containing protein [Anaerolineae bacterium]|nr:zinc ribbon domain-containing protein [Anaerolineae bacterium]